MPGLISRRTRPTRPWARWWDQRRGPWKRVPVVVKARPPSARCAWCQRLAASTGGDPPAEYPLELERDRDRHVIAVAAGGDLHAERASPAAPSPRGTSVTGTPARLKTAAGVSSQGRPNVPPVTRGVRGWAGCSSTPSPIASTSSIASARPVASSRSRLRALSLRQALCGERYPRRDGVRSARPEQRPPAGQLGAGLLEQLACGTPRLQPGASSGTAPRRRARSVGRSATAAPQPRRARRPPARVRRAARGSSAAATHPRRSSRAGRQGTLPGVAEDHRARVRVAAVRPRDDRQQRHQVLGAACERADREHPFQPRRALPGRCR